MTRADDLGDNAGLTPTDALGDVHATEFRQQVIEVKMADLFAAIDDWENFWQIGSTGVLSLKNMLTTAAQHSHTRIHERIPLMSTSEDETVPVRVKELEDIRDSTSLPQWITIWAAEKLPKPKLVTVDLDEIKAIQYLDELKDFIGRLEKEA